MKITFCVFCLLASHTLFAQSPASNSPSGALVRGLQGWWPFKEQVGSVYHDYSGNGYSMTNVGTISWRQAVTPIVSGNSITSTVSGSSYLKSGSSACNFTTGSTITINAWARPHMNADYEFIVARWASNQGYGLGWDPTHHLFVFNDTGFCFSSGATTQDVWSMVTGVLNYTGSGYSYKVYLNGVLDIAGSSNNAATITSSGSAVLELGASGTGASFWYGSMADARIYNRELATNEITYLYTHPPGFTRWPQPNYVFPSFQNGVEQLNIFGSLDSTNFVQYPTNFEPSLGTVRDPAMWVANGYYWIAYTSGGFGLSTSFGIAKSDYWGNNFQTIANVDCSSIGSSQMVWGPLPFTDPADNSFHIIFSSSTNGLGHAMVPYHIEPIDTVGFTTWGNPSQITGVSSVFTNTILASIVKKSSTYYLWTKDDVGRTNVIFTSSSPFSGYSLASVGPIPGWGDGGRFEGVYPVKFGTDWRVYMDNYLGPGSGGEYTSDSADDWATWSTPVSMNTAIKNGFMYPQ